MVRNDVHPITNYFLFSRFYKRKSENKIKVSIFIFNKNRKLIQKYVWFEFAENVELLAYCVELLVFSVKLPVFPTKLPVFLAKLPMLVTLLN